MQEPRAESKTRRRPKVLVVEDEPLIRFAVVDTLRDIGGMEVVEAVTADEAWAYLQQQGPVDVLFTDNRMPGKLSGARLAVMVREQYPETKVMVTSAHLRGSEWGGPVLMKPYNVDAVANRILEMADLTQMWVPRDEL